MDLNTDTVEDMNHVINLQANVKYSSPSADAVADDVRQLESFYRVVRALSPGEKIACRGLHPDRSEPPVGFRATAEETLRKARELEAAGYGIHPQVNEDDGAWGDDDAHKIRDENITKAHVLFADIDQNAEAVRAELVKEIGIAPHMDVESGGDDALHLYWAIRDVPLDMARRIQAAIAQWPGVDASCKNLGRVLRAPGTINTKYPHRPIVTIRASRDGRLDADATWAAFGPMTEALEAKQAEEAAQKAAMAAERAAERAAGDNGAASAKEALKMLKAFREYCIRRSATTLPGTNRRQERFEVGLVETQRWKPLLRAFKDVTGTPDEIAAVQEAADKLFRLHGAPTELQRELKDAYDARGNARIDGATLTPEEYIEEHQGDDKVPVTILTARAIYRNVRKALKATNELHSHQGVLGKAASAIDDLTEVHRIQQSRILAGTDLYRGKASKVRLVMMLYNDLLLAKGLEARAQGKAADIHKTRLEVTKEIRQEVCDRCNVSLDYLTSKIHTQIKEKGLFNWISGKHGPVDADGVKHHNAYAFWPRDVLNEAAMSQAIAERATQAAQAQDGGHSETTEQPEPQPREAEPAPPAPTFASLRDSLDHPGTQGLVSPVKCPVSLRRRSLDPWKQETSMGSRWPSPERSDFPGVPATPSAAELPGDIDLEADRVRRRAALEADGRLLRRLLAMMMDPACPHAERLEAKLQSREVRARINASLEQGDDDVVARSTHDRIWVTRDEETISVDEMDNEHLLRAFQWNQRRIGSEKRIVVKNDLKRWTKVFEAELHTRGIHPGVTRRRLAELSRIRQDFITVARPLALEMVFSSRYDGLVLPTAISDTIKALGEGVSLSSANGCHIKAISSELWHLMAAQAHHNRETLDDEALQRLLNSVAARFESFLRQRLAVPADSNNPKHRKIIFQAYRDALAYKAHDWNIETPGSLKIQARSSGTHAKRPAKKTGYEKARGR